MTHKEISNYIAAGICFLGGGLALYLEQSVNTPIVILFVLGAGLVEGTSLPDLLEVIR